MWIAQDAGIFARNGLEVDARVASATTGLASLLSGEINIQVGGGSEMMNGVANGADLVTLGNIAPVSALRFEVATAIKSKTDLVGKRLGITRFGSATDTALRTLLKQQGLNPDKDVTFIQLETPANVSAALISGNIQGALASPPLVFKLEDAGLHPLYDLGKLGVPDTTAVVVANRAWVTANKATVQRFMDSLIQGVVREKSDKALALATMKKNLKFDDDVALNKTYDYYASTVVTTEPYSKPEQFADIVALINAKTGKLKDFDTAKVIDNSFVQSAVERGLAKG